MRRLRMLVLLVALALSAAGTTRAASVRAVESAALVVSEMDRSLRFFTDLLAFTKESDVELAGSAYEHLEGVFGARMRVARLRLGDESLELIEYLAPTGRPIPADARGNDRSFQHVAIVVSDMARAYRRLRDAGVRSASTGPERLPDWNRNAGGIEAFYFRDPDGHFLELIHFPEGKGDPRWGRPGERLFLGIDHTAIVVRDTDASLALYRDRLGLRVAGESENYGEEQEHLNNVFGARLRITALRASRGPGIELLEYLAPGDGRPYPADSRGNDLWSWQIRVVSDDADACIRSLRPAGGTWVSPGVIEIPDRELGFGRGAFVRDADGHGLLVVEKENER